MEKYKVVCNGVQIPVLTANVSKAPINRVFTGTQRDISQTEIAYFATVDISGAANIEIIANSAFENYEIRPKAFELSHKREGNTVVLAVNKPMHFVVELDGKHYVLHVFVNPPKAKVPENAIYFGPGEHKADLIRLHSGDTLYIDDGAVVHGCILALNAENVKIMGRGVLDSSTYKRYGDTTPGGREIIDSWQEIFPELEGKERQYFSPLTIYNCKNVQVEGIILRDAQFWAVTVRNGCENVVIDNIKLIGMWRYNADGVDICASKNVVLKNSFIRSFDDCVVARAAHMLYEETNLENVLVENNVLWCDWGKSLEVWAGYKPYAIRNVVFKNNYLIHLSNVAMDVTTWYCSKNTLIENISFYDTYIDGDKEYESLCFQEHEGQVYKNEQGFKPHLVKIGIERVGKPSKKEQGIEKVSDYSEFNAIYRNILVEGVYCDDKTLEYSVTPFEGVLVTENINVKSTM